MKTVGIVTEYNPFHKGHQYHIEASKQITGADYCIAVMSGNFVQRGDPAIINKWARAHSALKSGADIVIEIPVHFATSSAEFFSMASIALLNNTGIVDAVCFGSEIGEIDPLDAIASVLANEPIKYKELLSTYLNQGLNYPTARSKALIDFLTNHPIEKVINSPNNILGIEYLKAIKRLDSNIIPYTIKRIGSGYHDEDINTPIASATAIRRVLRQTTNDEYILKEMLPDASYRSITEGMNHFRHTPIFSNDFLPLLKFKLLTTSPKELKKTLDITEGLENRILSLIMEVASWDDLLDQLMTKRYTRTKINRALIHILLGIDKKSFETFNRNGYAQYIRVLGFRKSAQHIMKKMKIHASVPIIGNIKSSEKKLTSLQQKMLYDEIMATNIYNTIVLGKYGTLLKNDYTQPVIIID